MDDRCNNLMFAGVLINLVVSIVWLVGFPNAFVGKIMVLPAFTGYLGLLISLGNDSKIGPLITLISSVIYVPIGAIGGYGAYKVLTDKKGNVSLATPAKA